MLIFKFSVLKYFKILSQLFLFWRGLLYQVLRNWVHQTSIHSVNTIWLAVSALKTNYCEEQVSNGLSEIENRVQQSFLF